MVWNKTLPADSSPFRISAGLIRANWDAIETGGVPYDYLQLSEQVANPTRADNIGWLYTKESASQTELFYEDDRNPASVIQLTSNGRLGSSSTNIIVNTITIGSSSTQFTANQVIVAHCTVNGAGVLVNGYNVTAATRLTDPGRYQITVAADVLKNINYRVIAQAFDLTSASGRYASVHSKPTPIVATPVDILINITGSNATTFHNEQFDVIIVGGR